MTKVYVDKMPVDCVECPVYNGDRGTCNLLEDYTEFEWGKKPTNCPLEEVKRGQWLKGDDETVSGECSVCGWKANYYETDVCGMPYCPSCGARMKKTNEYDA